MARILITGSADGLGQLAARALASQGHRIILHARSAARGQQARQAVPSAEGVVVGDLASMDEAADVARQANALGPLDAIIHNAGVYQASPEVIFRVNTLAPYILTALIRRPQRLIYLSSGMHLHGRADRSGLERSSYSDSKLYVVMLCMAVARRWPDVYANAVDPGWVPTKMGGRGVPDDLQQGYETQAWLASSDDAGARASGRYFYHRAQQPAHPQASDAVLQDALLRQCEKITGIALPR